MSSRDRTELGRYVLHDEIASGGMATVHLGRLRGPVGFSRTVAIKRLHPQFAKDPDFVSMFLDEARLAARIRHPNVVPTLDVVSTDGELFLVMEYIHGVSLQRMVRRARELGEQLPVDVTCGIAVGALRGLHAAHEAKSERGRSLDIVHRDVSPQNVMIDVDGQSRVLDFGVAKASWRVQTTRQGQVKGKVAYMAPEQVMGGTVGPWTDVHALGIVLWEALTGERLFPVTEERGLLARFTQPVEVSAPSTLNPEVPPELDAAVLQALAHTPDERQPNAQVMADQIEAATTVGTSARIGRYVQYLAEEELGQRASRIAEIEGSSVVSVVAMTPLLLQLEPKPATDPETPATASATSMNDTVVERLPPSRPTSEDASKISMARTLDGDIEIPPPPRRRSTTKIAVGAAAVLTALFGLAALLTEDPHAGKLEGLAVAAGSEPAPQVIAAPASAAPEQAPEPVPAAATEAPASGVVDLADIPVEKTLAELPLEETKEAPRTAKPAARRKPAATAPARPGTGCNPPYTVDARGVRHLKMECVH